MKRREHYLEKAIQWKDTAELIKVITGVRRCGKSSLLALFRDFLISDGVPKGAIVHINFEDYALAKVNTHELLFDYLTQEIDIAKKSQSKTYLLLDEVQRIEGWERVVNSLRLNRDNDLYLTGSNAQLLSGPLATLLSGRYVELSMFPLSFREYLEFQSEPVSGDTVAIEEHFHRYLHWGGFPGLADLPDAELIYNNYLSGILNTVIVKDVIALNALRDVDLLDKIVRYLADNVGSFITAKGVADYLGSSGRSVSTDTIDNYLRALEEAFLFYRARRNDLRGKGLMKTHNKFYIVDLGLRTLLQGSQASLEGKSLENVVYFELLRRGYRVSIGKYNALEVDFVAEKPGELHYYQVTKLMTDEIVRDREFAPLKAISDNHPKTVLSTERMLLRDSEDGIEHRNIIDFLLEEK